MVIPPFFAGGGAGSRERQEFELGNSHLKNRHATPLATPFFLSFFFLRDRVSMWLTPNISAQGILLPYSLEQTQTTTPSTAPLTFSIQIKCREINYIFQVY
jgi:hypothetical protein